MRKGRGTHNEAGTCNRAPFGKAIALITGAVFQLLLALITITAAALDAAVNDILLLIVVMTLLGMGVTLLILFRRGWVAIGVFLLLVTQPIFSVYFDHVLNDVDPIWKSIFPNHLMLAPVQLLMIHTQFLVACILLALAVTTANEPACSKYNTLGILGVGACWSISGSMALVVLATALTTTRDAFMMDVEGSDRFVMTVGPLLIGLGAGIGTQCDNPSMKALSLFCLGCALLIALSGYRSVLVFAATAFAAGRLSNRRLGIEQLLLIAVGIAVAYNLMSYLSLIRSTGVSVGDLLTGKAQLPPFSETSSRAGGAEQIAVFTAYYANGQEPYYGLTYLYAIVRSLPQAIYTLFPYPPRIQDILVEGGPIQFKQVSLNLGAYFFAETILNFGAGFSLLMNALAVVALTWVESRRNRTAFRRLSYPAVAMLMPVLALYGSTNFIKQLLTVLTITLLIRLVGLPLGRFTGQFVSRRTAPLLK